MAGGNGMRDVGKRDHEHEFLDRVANGLILRGGMKVNDTRFLDYGKPALWVSDDTGTYMVRVERVSRSVMEHA